MSARPPRFRSDPLPQDRGTTEAAGVKADREEVPVKAIAALPFPSPGLGSGSRKSPARSLSRVEQRAVERPLVAHPRATKDREAGGEGQRGAHVSSAAPRARRRGGRGPRSRIARGPSHTYSLRRLRPGSTNQEPKHVEERGGARTSEVRKPRPRGLQRRGGTSGENTALGSCSSAQPASPPSACVAASNPLCSPPVNF